jgi:DNA-directed RNA polymerase sigma subunit (sigma70/sigma32)
VGTKAKGKLVQTIAAMSQAEVARALGISREAVRQTENRALAKVRAALLPLYLDLCR